MAPSHVRKLGHAKWARPSTTTSSSPFPPTHATMRVHSHRTCSHTPGSSRQRRTRGGVWHPASAPHAQLRHSAHPSMQPRTWIFSTEDTSRDVAPSQRTPRTSELQVHTLEYHPCSHAPGSSRQRRTRGEVWRPASVPHA